MSSNTPKKKTLVIDIGGTNIKLIATDQPERMKIPSNAKMSAQDVVDAVISATTEAGWEYDQLSIGCPLAVVDNKPKAEPANLGKGWIGFDFEKAFGKPAKVINDAAMQAYGCYEGGTMLFLGLGTGLGTTVIKDGTIVPLEAAHLPYKSGTYEDYVGKESFETRGRKKWQRHVFSIVEVLRKAFIASDVVLGGGNTKNLDPFPEHCRKVNNYAAFTGGFKMWGEERQFD